MGPSTDEWIKKMCCIHTMESYSAIKKDKIMSFAGKWIGLENIMLRSASLRESRYVCFLSYVETREKIENKRDFR